MVKFVVPDLRYEETFIAKCHMNSNSPGGSITNLGIFKTIIISSFIDPLVQSFLTALVLTKMKPVFQFGRKMGVSTITSIKSTFASIFKII